MIFHQCELKMDGKRICTQIFLFIHKSQKQISYISCRIINYLLAAACFCVNIPFIFFFDFLNIFNLINCRNELILREKDFFITNSAFFIIHSKSIEGILSWIVYRYHHGSLNGTLMSLLDGKVSGLIHRWQ